MKTPNIWEYTENIVAGELAYLSIACTTRCNFKCTFCSKKDQPINDLDFQLLKNALAEALEAGLRKVELTGGEALLYPFFFEILEYLTENNVQILMVTNGSLITAELAERLFEARVNTAISLSTLKPLRYDQMTGTKNQLDKVINALHLLKKAGYSEEQEPLLAIHALGTKENYEELDSLRKFTGEIGCGFVLNRAIPVGGLDASNTPTHQELKKLLDDECASHGEATIPFSGDYPCNRLLAGCYIGADANVRPCPSIDLVAGSLKEKSLSLIWHNSKVLKESRNINHLLEGSCGKCPERKRCYGCRAVAYAVWGELTGPDPDCFRFSPDEKWNQNSIKNNQDISKGQ